MPRYRLNLEYDGSPFVGWQRQDNGPSIQAALETAIERFCGAPVAVAGAGRTDAGVHALGQVAHVDLPRPFPVATIRDAINFHLKPAPIAVLAVAEEAADFHARFSATERSYLYRILNRRAGPTLDRGRVWWLPLPLDITAMQQAAAALVGRHDFTSFRSTMCQADSAIKTLERLTVSTRGDEVWIEARARSFLHNQVRIIAGSLKLVGDGAWPVAAVATVLAARDRRRGGPTAPPGGLYLISVGYERRAADPADATIADDSS